MGQHYVEVEARVVCPLDTAKALVDHVDSVEYEDGITTMRVNGCGESSPFVLAIKATERLEEAAKAVGIDIEDGFDFEIRAEALVEVDGVWRRRGEVVPLASVQPL